MIAFILWDLSIRNTHAVENSILFFYPGKNNFTLCKTSTVYSAGISYNWCMCMDITSARYVLPIHCLVVMEIIAALITC